MPETPAKFFLTTPIYYVNARPHIGHAYTTIVADVLARRSRAQGNDTWFLTGTDEHGQKIERSAQAAGIPPQQFSDNVSAEFKQLWDRMGLTYDQYIRTTSPAHKRGVQKLWRELESRGHIYLSSYTGQYCVSEEIFVEGPPGTIGPDGRPTETVTEENYFFRLSDFQEPLIELIETERLLIETGTARNEILSFLRGNIASVFRPGELRKSFAGNPVTFEEMGQKAVELGRAKEYRPGKYYVFGALRDLSISRSSFNWGIPVPEDPKHVIYVWLDALANYMTAVGYGSDAVEDRAKFNRYWPADLHLVGKEIIRQHCIYWPAFLLALNPELQHDPTEPMPVLSTEQHQAWAEEMLPKKVVAHGWLLFEESKMSKSKGNIVRTETILEAFGEELYAKQFPDSTKRDRDLFASDVLRYFLLREIPFGQDGSFSFDAMITRYNADLANGYGNLVSRTLGLISQNFPDGLPYTPQQPWHCAATGKAWLNRPDSPITSDEAFAGTDDVRAVIADLLHSQLFSREDVPSVSRVSLRSEIVDRYLSIHKPWVLAKSEDPAAKLKLVEVLYTAAESIRILTALLYPVLPYATAAVWRQLGLGDIEAAAQRGDLTNLQWGGLQPGTRLGPLAPIFPRADKGLAQIMANIEQETADKKNALAGLTDAADAATPTATEFPSAPLASATPASGDAPLAAEQATYDPAAGPRTATLAEPNPGAQVGGSSSPTAVLPTSGHHTDAPASGIFAHQPADASPQITIDDFAKVELRVAKVLVCERIPKADKLLRLEVDLGYEIRQILSGIAEWYTPEDLLGRRIVVITNLAPRKMRGLESHGMLLAASAPEGGKPALATFLDTDDLPLGSRLK